MNSYPGVITEILTSDHMALVRIKINETLLTSIVLDLPSKVPALHTGNSIQVLFKETAVLISEQKETLISSRNQISGTVEKVEVGHLLSRVQLSTDIGRLHSVITSEAAKILSLHQGSQVTALIKTNEITLAYD